MATSALSALAPSTRASATLSSGGGRAAAREKEQEEDAHQAIVQTPYGRGLVVRTRRVDGTKEVRLLEWGGEGGDDDDASMNGRRSRRRLPPRRHPFMLYTRTEYPSVEPRAGDDVVCRYGRGRVTNAEDVAPPPDPTEGSESLPAATTKPLRKYTVALTSWRLNGRSRVACHFVSPAPPSDGGGGSSPPPPALSVVRKRTVREMDAHELVEYAQSQKAIATDLFSRSKDRAAALEAYARAIDAVRNVQHDASSTNELRSDLVVVLATCSNNAATCCVQLKRWDDAGRFAANAMILLDAMCAKRGSKVHGAMTRVGLTDAKVFGEWRVKSRLVEARSAMERGDEVAAAEALKRAGEIAAEYMPPENGGTTAMSKDGGNISSSSSKILSSQMKEARRLSAEIVKRRKATKNMEKRRAEAMFGGSGKHREQSGGGEKSKTKKGDGEKNADAATNARSGEAGKIGTTNAKAADDGDVAATKAEFAGAPNGRSPIQRQSSLRNGRNGESGRLQRASSTGSGTGTDEPRGERPEMKKSVSFSQRPPQVREFEKKSSAENGTTAASADASAGERPWHSQHGEALILMGVAGLAVAAVVAMGLRRP